MKEQIEAYSDLLSKLAKEQKGINFYRKFSGDSLLVWYGGSAAFLIIFLIGQYWAYGLALIIGIVSYWIYCLTDKSESEIAKRQTSVRNIYQNHLLEIKRASLVRISDYYYCWIFGQEELVFQVDRSSLSIARNGLAALTSLGVSINDFAIPLLIKVAGRIPARTYHREIKFSANACFLKGADCDIIVRRFHSNPEELESELRGYIARHISATIAAAPQGHTHEVVWNLRNTMVEITELNAEACITSINFT